MAWRRQVEGKSGNKEAALFVFLKNTSKVGAAYLPTSLIDPRCAITSSWVAQLRLPSATNAESPLEELGVFDDSTEHQLAHAAQWLHQFAPSYTLSVPGHDSTFAPLSHVRFHEARQSNRHGLLQRAWLQRMEPYHLMAGEVPENFY